MEGKPEVPNKVLMVDSDTTTGKRVEEQLGKLGIQLISAVDLNTAMYRFNSEFFRVALIDSSFRDLEPMTLIQKWRAHEVQEKRTCGFLVMTGDGTSKTSQALLEEIGGVETVKKPLNPATLFGLIVKAYGNHKTAEAKRKLSFDILTTLVAKGRFDDAIKAITMRRQDLGDEYYELATEIYEKAGKLDEAIKVAEKVPDGVMAPMRRVNMKARLYLKAGRMDESRKCFEEADKMAPNQIDRINDMAEMYMQMKLPDAAVARFKQLMKANPENPDYKFDVLQKLEDAGFPDHADNFCRETTAPKEVVRFYNNHGVILAKEEKLGEALKQYDMALRFFPKSKDNFRIYYNVALAQLKLKTPEAREKAIVALKKTLELNPEFDKAKETLTKLKVA